MQARRFWWFALLVMVAIVLIGQQILAKITVTQAQDNLNGIPILSPPYPPVTDATWEGYTKTNFESIFPDGETACNSFKILFDVPVTLEGTKLEYFEEGGKKGEVHQNRCYLKALYDSGYYDYEYASRVNCPIIALPDRYIYTGGTHGACVLPSEYEKIKPYLDKILPLFAEPNCKDKKDEKKRQLFPCKFRKYAEKYLPYILVEVSKANETDGESKITNAQLAYILATAQHESNLGERLVERKPSKDKDYFKRLYWDDLKQRENLGNTEEEDADKFKGRGFVQITGRENYSEWSKKLGIDLINNPDLATDPAIAARILVEGMRDGTFTTRRIDQFINDTQQDYFNARKIVNGDKNKKLEGEELTNGQRIANIAKEYAEALGVKKNDKN